MPAYEQEDAAAACARWIYAAGLLLSTTEHLAFKQFINMLRPAFKVPGRWSISYRLLDQEYLTAEAAVTRTLNASKRISLILDGWSNPRNKSIINYLVATEDNVLFIRSVNTTVDRYTSQYLADKL